jgi:hypothetical protein
MEEGNSNVLTDEESLANADEDILFMNCTNSYLFLLTCSLVSYYSLNQSASPDTNTNRLAKDAPELARLRTSSPSTPVRARSASLRGLGDPRLRPDLDVFKRAEKERGFYSEFILPEVRDQKLKQ